MGNTLLAGKLLAMRRPLLLFAVLVPLFLAVITQGPPGEAKPRVTPTLHPLTELFVRKGCIACHIYTGVRSATGIMGPELTKVGKRMTVAQMAALLRDPQGHKPGTAMPSLDLSERQVALLVKFMIEGPPKKKMPPPIVNNGIKTANPSPKPW